MHREDASSPALLCISTYEKGQALLTEAARRGCSVVLLTTDNLRDADWPKESLAAFETMPENLSPEDVLPHVARLARHRRIGRVIALDEFDLDTAALVREHLLLPGMSRSAVRPFRDKLTMRQVAAQGGISVPEFTGVTNHDQLWEFLQRTEGPWMLKPRASASAIGIRKFAAPDEVWPLLERLGSEATHHLVERFIPGDIFHVEGLTWAGTLQFALAFAYGQAPFETMHSGGIFSTRTLERGSPDAMGLLSAHAQVIRALGAQNGPTHTEFIRAHSDGRFYFLESAARVGGAYIAEVTEAASGLNPWMEWARMEAALLQGAEYALPASRQDYAGSAICLARQEHPDTSSYSDPEIVFRLRKHHHAGLIVQSTSAERIGELVENYTQRFLRDFYARLDAPDKPTS